MPIYNREKRIQDEIIEYLKTRSWLVERMIGNAFQVGIPDLFVWHREWGFRWIDVKVEGKYSFTKAQKIKWPLWESYDLGVWILTGADEENYRKLFAPPNWREFDKWNLRVHSQQEIDELLDEIED